MAMFVFVFAAVIVVFVVNINNCRMLPIRVCSHFFLDTLFAFVVFCFVLRTLMRSACSLYVFLVDKNI